MRLEAITWERLTEELAERVTGMPAPEGVARRGRGC